MAIQLHVIKNIHMAIAAYATLLMYIFAIIGLGIVPIFTNHEYWRFGAPLTLQADPTQIQTLESSAAIVAIMFFLMAERVIGQIRDEVVAWLPVEEIPLVTQYVGIVVYYMRSAAHVVFMRSQISFVVAIVVADIMATTFCKWISIKQRRGGGNPHTPGDGGFTPYWGRIDVRIVTLGQVIMIPGFFLLYDFAGLFDSPYFRVGPPLTIFGTTVVSHHVQYWIVVVLTFIFACLASASRNNIDRWHSSVLQNIGEVETGLTVWEARMIAVNRMFLFYLGLMFVYSFFTTQYFFVFIYMFADMLMTTFWYARNGRLPGTSSDHSKTERIKQTGFTVIIVTVLQTIFEIILVLVIATSGWFDDTYFTWGKNIIVFGATVATREGFNILLSYVAFDRVASTLDANIIGPDMDAWLYYGAKGHVDQYEDWDILWIIITMRFNFLFRYVLRIMFVLSNYSFVVIAAAVDIPLTIIVDEFHIIYKHNLKQVTRINTWITGKSKTP